MMHAQLYLWLDFLAFSPRFSSRVRPHLLMTHGGEAVQANVERERDPERFLARFGRRIQESRIELSLHTASRRKSCPV
jgi:hypothetical protein